MVSTDDVLVLDKLRLIQSIQYSIDIYAIS
jgi:hypothetical protein